MARYVLTTLFQLGDVLPFIRIGRALRARGHTVTVVTHCAFEALARDADLGFEAIDTTAEFESFVEDNVLLDTPSGFATVYKRHVGPRLAREHAAILRHCEDKTVLVTRSAPGVVAQIVAEQLSLPLVRVMLSPAFVTTMSAVPALLKTVLPDEINAVRATAGMSPVEDWERWLRIDSTCLGLWPDWFAPRAADSRMDVRLVGFLLGDRKAKLNINAETNARVSGEPGQTRQPLDDTLPILLTGGSGLYWDASFFEAGVGACVRLNRRALLLARYEKMLPRELPPQMEWVPFAEFGTLMPRVAAVVHHGGIGTTAEALAAGIPQLVLGSGADRPDNAAQLVRLGVGECLDKGRWTVQGITASLRSLLQDESVRVRCREIASRMAQHDAQAATCRVLEEVALQTRPVHAISASDQVVAEPRASSIDTRALVATLSPARRALLERGVARMRASTGAAEQRSRVERHQSPNKTPLSYNQLFIWHFEQRHPRTSTWNAQSCFRLAGKLDVEALSRSVDEVFRRHEALRTTTVASDGVPAQVIRPPAAGMLRHVDFSNVIPEERMTHVHALAVHEYFRAMDLAEGPLARAFLLRFSEDEHAFVLIVQRIVLDGLLLGVFFSETLATYSALVEGKPSPLPEPKFQYSDYAIWQREHLASRADQKWIDRRSEHILRARPIDLPFDRPAPALRSTDVHVAPVPVAQSVLEAMTALGRAESATEFVILAAAFAGFAARIGSQTDILVLAPSELGRALRPEFEFVFGRLADPLLLRADLKNNPTFRELVRAMRREVLEAGGHAGVPSSMLLKQDSPLDSPLAQIILNHVSEANVPSDAPHGVTVEKIEVPACRPQRMAEIVWTVWRSGGAVTVSMLACAADRFDSGTVSNLASGLAAFVSDVVQSPDARFEREGSGRCPPSSAGRRA